MSEQFKHILLEQKGSVATITLNQPPLNILDIAMMTELLAAINSVEADKHIHLLVVQGAGEKAFSAGASIEEHAPDKVEEMLGAFHAVFRALSKSRLITIARAHGHCLGGGCELAIMCDFVVASADAKFGVPEIKLGCFPPVAAALFPSLIGRRHAERLMLTGDVISAEEAFSLGLVTHLAKPENLQETCDKLIAKLADKSPAVMALLRRSEPGWRDEFLRNLDHAERVFLDELVKLPDMKEGLTAFTEKRKPVWSGV